MLIKTNDFWLASSMQFSANSVGYKIAFESTRPIINVLSSKEVFKTSLDLTQGKSNPTPLEKQFQFEELDKYIWRDLKNEITEFNGIVTTDFNQENIKQETIQRIGCAIIRKLSNRNADVGFFFPDIPSQTEPSILYQEHYAKHAEALAADLGVPTMQLTTVDTDYKYLFSKNVLAVFTDNSSDYIPLIMAQNPTKFCTFCDVSNYKTRYVSVWLGLSLFSSKEDTNLVIERYKQFKIKKEYNFDHIKYQREMYGKKKV